MSYEKLDADELLRLAVDAMNGNRDADAVVMLKTLLEREPGHVMARYLLAAQHAQLGMMDRAEAGFREVVGLAPEFPIARFQLGQLLLTKSESDEAYEMLAPLATRADAVGAYARALCAAARDDVPTTVAELQAGLELPQDIPALEHDMRQLLERLASMAGSARAVEAEVEAVAVPPSPIFMTGYGQNAGRDD